MGCGGRGVGGHGLCKYRALRRKEVEVRCQIPTVSGGADVVATHAANVAAASAAGLDASVFEVISKVHGKRKAASQVWWLDTLITGRSAADGLNCDILHDLG